MPPTEKNEAEPSSNSIKPEQVKETDICDYENHNFSDFFLKSISHPSNQSHRKSLRPCLEMIHYLVTSRLYIDLAHANPCASLCEMLDLLEGSHILRCIILKA